MHFFVFFCGISVAQRKVCASGGEYDEEGVGAVMPLFDCGYHKAFLRFLGICGLIFSVI